MLLLNPPTVRFGNRTWTDVAIFTIDRASPRLIEEWSDAGPHAVLVDAPEQRLTITVIRRLTRDEPSTLSPGTLATLTAHAAPAAGDAGRLAITAAAVITSITYTLASDPARGATQTITLRAISPDGQADPIAITSGAGGAL